MGDAQTVLDRAEAALRPLHVDAMRSWWDANVSSNEENERRRVRTELALSDALADGDLFDAVEVARRNGVGGIAKRQLDLLHGQLLPHQAPEELRHRIVKLEASVEARYAQHRGVVGDREVDDNEIKRILRGSDDVDERRAAWEASKTIGAAVADDVRELARLRNRAAQGLGHRDWFALAVATMEMDEERLLSTLAECDELTAGPFAAWKAEVDERLARRFGCAVAELRPWHYEDPFFQEVPTAGGDEVEKVFAGADVVALARATYDGLGLETGELLARSDLYPRVGKCQHAFCIDIDRDGDVRVLANVVHDRYWADTMLHELGHGVYDLGHDPELPWLLRDCHVTVTEGVAIMMGKLAQEAEWLRVVAGLGDREAGGLAAGLRATRAAEELVLARWVLVMTRFEQALYADPERDLSRLWWDLVSRHQLINPPEGRSEPDWAAKIHIACAPVYYHAYLYGDLVAAQLRTTLEQRAGGLVGRPEAGAFLVRNVFATGESVRWDELVEQATGEPLSPAHLARDIASGLGD